MIAHIGEPFLIIRGNCRYCRWLCVGRVIHKFHPVYVRLSVREMANRIKWCLIGIPDQEGVMNVGGRLGAASGPRAFQRAFARLKGLAPVRESLALKTELQLLKPDVLENHRRAAELIEKTHALHPISVVIGGGHDHGYTHLLGVSRALAGKKIGCINIDAHLDVRKPDPLITSGSPFYLAIESGCLHPSQLIEFGIQSHCNGPELWAYIEKNKIEVIPMERLRHGKAAAAFSQALKKLSASCDAVVISLDLDAAASAFAPGVSAPQADGFSACDFLEMMELAGGDPKVVSLGVFELNPEHDVDGRTSALAATSVWHFIEQALKRP